MMGIITFFPLGFLPGYVIAWGLRKANLLRVPPEVELEGLDVAEFEIDYYPEYQRVDEVIVQPDGQFVPAREILLDAYNAGEALMLQLAGSIALMLAVVGSATVWAWSAGSATGSRTGGRTMNTAPDTVDAGWSDKVAAFFTFGPGYTTGIYILVALGFTALRRRADRAGSTPRTRSSGARPRSCAGRVCAPRASPPSRQSSRIHAGSPISRRGSSHATWTSDRVPRECRPTRACSSTPASLVAVVCAVIALIIEAF